MQLPPELLRLIHQLRKPDVDLAYSAVSWSRADVALREATKRVTVAKGYVRDKWEREPGYPHGSDPSTNACSDPTKNQCPAKPSGTR